MSDSHLRAAVQVALAARGLGFELAYYAAQSASQWRLGNALREEIFAGIPGGDARGRLADAEPDLWRRVPLIAGLGFRQTSLFQSLIPYAHMFSTEVDRQAAVLGGIFNLVITLVDHGIDERGAGETIFRSLNEEVIRAIFASPVKACAQLQSMASASQGVQEQLLLSLISLCCRHGGELLARTGNYDAWKKLGGVIVALLQSEREMAASSWLSYEEALLLLPHMETKSALPSLACMHIACLGRSRLEDAAARELLTASERMGRLFWRIDDVVDLLKDLRSGTPNALLLRMADHLNRERRPYASDPDIYDEVDACAEELADLANLEQQHSSTDLNGRAANGQQQCAEFARLLIAGWIGWREPMAAGTGAGAATLSRNAAEHCSARALHYLLQQHDRNYEEATHHLHFPRFADGAIRYETHPSVLSHRAVILDALLDGAEAGLPVSRSVLAKDVMAILHCKHPDVRGGWSYIQQAPELPPDADDLGQVLQVLARYGGPDLASICDEAIRLVLDGANEDGAFETWILDPSGNSFADQTLRDYLPIMGGSGVHVEVVSNLLYGLLLYDAQRYRLAVYRAVSYLESAQSPDGGWQSKWYAGSYYGTWRVASVLGRVAPDSAALSRSRRFLIESQRVDGGWGDDDVDPLSTALALLAMCAGDMQPVQDSLARGADYLAHTQRPDGSWRASPWIRFPTKDGVVTHGSASATTAFCLKARITIGKAMQSQCEEVDSDEEAYERSSHSFNQSVIGQP